MGVKDKWLKACKNIHSSTYAQIRTDCYSQANQMQVNAEKSTRLCLLLILFIYNNYGGFCQANSQSLLAILQACLTSAVSGKCVAIYSSVEMMLIA